MRIHAFVLALIGVLALAQPARAVLIAAEEAIETSTTGVSIPASATGVIVAKLCPSCAASVLKLTAKTRFLVGKTQVSFTDLQKFIRSAPSSGMVVLYDPRAKLVTRIIVQGKLPAAKY